MQIPESFWVSNAPNPAQSWSIPAVPMVWPNFDFTDVTGMFATLNSLAKVDIMCDSVIRFNGVPVPCAIKAHESLKIFSPKTCSKSLKVLPTEK